MAAILCDMCQSEEAIMMQTNLGNGDTQSIGPACLLPFALGMAISLSEGAEAEEQAAYADPVAALLANLAPSMLQLAKSAVPRPPRRKAAGKSGDPAQHGTGEAETAAAASAAGG